MIFAAQLKDSRSCGALWSAETASPLSKAPTGSDALQSASRHYPRRFILSTEGSLFLPSPFLRNRLRGQLNQLGIILHIDDRRMSSRVIS